MARFLLVKMLAYIKIGGAFEQAITSLGIKKEQWKKMEIMALQLARTIHILQPQDRFDPGNHAPMLPPCCTCVLDTFPKEVHCGSFKNGKYGYKIVKGSIVVDFRGNLLDFQINEYGNRHDAVFWPYHQNAMGWLPWEYGLADMAYELCPNILTQFVWRECLTHTQMLYNAVLGFYRSRVEAVVADVVNNKGLFSHPWAGNMPFLKALMTIEVHATQLHRRMFGGTRYNEVSGSYGHREFFR